MAVQTHYTHAQLEELWTLAGGSPQWADTAAAIAQAESGGCLYAKAGPNDDRPEHVCAYRHTTTENSYGLWQINRDKHLSYSASSLYTALGNAKAAVAISGDGKSFEPWTTYKDGAYKAHLRVPGATTTQPGKTASAPAKPIPKTGLRGYADFNSSVSSHLTRSLQQSKRHRHAALRTVSGLRRVR